MNAHTHHAAEHASGTPLASARPASEATTASRPRWLLPGLVGALIVGGLVVAGVVSLSVVLYVGLFGGMILMHTGGHSHGGHGGSSQVGAGRDPRGDRADDAADLRRHSPATHDPESRSGAGLDARARTDSTTSETDDHDSHTSRGCH